MVLVLLMKSVLAETMATVPALVVSTGLFIRDLHTEYDAHCAVSSMTEVLWSGATETPVGCLLFPPQLAYESIIAIVETFESVTAHASPPINTSDHGDE